MNFAIVYILGMGVLFLAVVFGGIGIAVGQNASARTILFASIAIGLVVSLPMTVLMDGVSNSDINAAGEPFGYELGAVLFALVAGFCFLGGHLGRWSAGRRSRKDPLVETSK